MNPLTSARSSVEGNTVRTTHRGMLGLAALLVTGAMGLVGLSDAIAQSAEELTAEIKERCERQMGQYGRTLVLSCVEQDIAAVNKVAGYQRTHEKITARCLNQMRQYGFVLVASCIEQDIQADRKLQGY